MAQVTQVLGEANVNIKAFSAPEVTGTGKLRLLVADLEGARAALKAAKIKFTEETALLLSLENKPGALREVADLLTKARINITCGYCTPSREGKRAIVVLTVSNMCQSAYYLAESIARRVLGMSRQSSRLLVPVWSFFCPHPVGSCCLAAPQTYLFPRLPRWFRRARCRFMVWPRISGEQDGERRTV
jgi:hypothetical protein